MNLLIISASVIAALSAISLIAAWKGAVQGYEDELGFHEGAVPVPVTTSHGLRARAQSGHRQAVVR